MKKNFFSCEKKIFFAHFLYLFVALIEKNFFSYNLTRFFLITWRFKRFKRGLHNFVTQFMSYTILLHNYLTVSQSDCVTKTKLCNRVTQFLKLCNSLFFECSIKSFE